MAIPGGARLRAQMHCLSHDGREVITAQQWFDPDAAEDRPRSWLRLLRNGQVVKDNQITGRAKHDELAEFWRAREVSFEPTKLTEDQMWVRLRELTGIEQTVCQAENCSIDMPVGWWICPLCGKDARRVAHGSLTGVRARGVIALPAAALRSPEQTS
jgi:hypothetical protein